jgi:adenine-specific DNA-methyltransferase
MTFEITRTELVWPGKYDEDGKRREPERPRLPFQVIERVNESRATRTQRQGKGMTLFDYFEPDTAETFEDGWRNKLIWGDNLLVMSSLLDQFAGKIDLIYIDPPFATGADFSVRVRLGDEGVPLTKQASLVEEKAYRDTWGSGADSYLTMIVPRLHSLRQLLAPTGSIFFHCDSRLNGIMRLALDEAFGVDRRVNEVVWCYTGPSSPGMRGYANKHDTIFWYARSDKWTFNPDAVRLPYKASTKRNEGRRTGFTTGNPNLVVELNPLGKYPEDWWELPVEAPASSFRTDYPTQKPERLLSRILQGSSNSGDLVADFFCGSGTTQAVAEKLGRRWIGCDLGRFAIHTTRKRLLGIPECKPFEVLNLGKYERQYWHVTSFGKMLDRDIATSVFEYIAFILKLYGATPAAGLQHIHGKIGAAFVHVGAVDAPVTIDEIASCVTECVALRAKELHVLGWEWEMGLHDPMTDEAKSKGVKLVLRQIPREVMERQATDKGDVTFFELAYLEVAIAPAADKHQIVVTLEDFVIPNPELVPDDVRDKITKWSDYVDYWAVDWDFSGDTFMQGWCSYRTRKDRTLALASDPHTCAGPGERAVMVKVIDIFGNDTSKIVRVQVG